MRKVRNVKTGLKARTKILFALEKESYNAVFLSNISSLSYSVVLYHLNLLKKENIVKRGRKRPYYWLLTGIGQKKLIP